MPAFALVGGSVNNCLIKQPFWAFLAPRSTGWPAHVSCTPSISCKPARLACWSARLALVASLLDGEQQIWPLKEPYLLPSVGLHWSLPLGCRAQRSIMMFTWVVEVGQPERKVAADCVQLSV